MILLLGTASLIAVQASMPPRLRHPDVHQHDVRRGLDGLLDRLGAVLGLADDLDVGLLLEHHLQAAAEQRVVVDHQHPDRVTGARRQRAPARRCRSCRSRTSTPVASRWRMAPSPPLRSMIARRTDYAR